MPDVNIKTIQQYYANLQKQGRLLNHQFGLTITRAGMEDFTLFGQSTSIPNRTLNTAELKYFGQTFEIPTTLDEGRRWSVELHSDAENVIYNKVREWQEEYASWQKSGGGIKGISGVNGYVDLYDHQMEKIVDSFTLMGILPLEPGEISLDQGGGDLVSFNTTFLFQICYNSKRGVNPLR